MHDCRRTQDNLIDLLFDELDGEPRARLTSEVAACAVCAVHYRTLAATLAACDEAAAAATPRESYWPQYHAALNRRLQDAAGDVQSNHARAQPSRAPFWNRWLTTSIRVPAPLAAAAMLLLVAASALSLALLARSAPEPVALAAPVSSQEAAAPQIKFIEVPVVQEKIITQTIYVPRRANGSNGGAAASRDNLAGLRRQNAPAPQVADAPPRANLSGFKPAGEVNLRIIKESDAREQ